MKQRGIFQEKLSARKVEVRDFWNQAGCDERLLLGGMDAAGYREQAAKRLELEPFIAEFADFASAKGKAVLEIAADGIKPGSRSAARAMIGR